MSAVKYVEGRLPMSQDSQGVVVFACTLTAWTGWAEGKDTGLSLGQECCQSAVCSPEKLSEGCTSPNWAEIYSLSSQSFAFSCQRNKKLNKKHELQSALMARFTADSISSWIAGWSSLPPSAIRTSQPFPETAGKSSDYDCLLFALHGRKWGLWSMNVGLTGKILANLTSFRCFKSKLWSSPKTPSHNYYVNCLKKLMKCLLKKYPTSTMELLWKPTEETKNTAKELLRLSLNPHKGAIVNKTVKIEGSFSKSLQKAPMRMLPKITQKIFNTGFFVGLFYFSFIFLMVPLMGCLWLCFDITDGFQNSFYVGYLGQL